MKKLLFSFLLLLTATTALWAQAPQRMSYQSIIRDGSNVVVASTPVGIKISVVRGTATGTAVYVETHRKTTNANGLVSLEIGEGTALVGRFADIDWSNGPYLIKTETDPTGGTNYSIPGIAPLNSVPYALYSANGTPGPKGEKGEKGDTGARGATGPTGAIGPQGLRGETGSTGPQGERGLTGSAGLPGASGAQGPIGLTGLQGAVGQTGPVGPQGIPGVAGLPGEAGPAGAIGPQGLTGLTGPIGLTGPVGATGPAGNDGAAGATGPQGVAGPQGPSGLQGLPGVPGPQGATGPQGPAGPTGAPGLLTSGSAAGNTPYWDGTQWVVNSSNLFNNGGNVGIGTAAPIEKLDITGNVKASGTVTAGTVTYPNAHGSANQVLTTTGSGTLTWTTPSSGGSGVPYTGATQGVDLGAYNLKVNGLTVGRGNGNITTNTASGKNALQSNTTGGFNTATGSTALQSNTTGAFNTANGATALESNISGINNTATGSYTLNSNTTGSHNTATGASALFNNITGGANTATGLEALYNNTSGLNNTATGASALYSNTTGINNTANGTSTLQNNTTGGFNTATGIEALFGNTTGGFNTAIGSPALSTNITGSRNTAVGSFADVASDNLTNATALGYGATVDANNKIQLGNASVTNVSTAGTITVGAVTYPKTHGANGQVLSTTGSGTLTWITPASGGVPYSGATGAVNLGNYDLTVHGLTVGRGGGGKNSNVALGISALPSNHPDAAENTAIGYAALINQNSSSARANTAVGFQSLEYNQSGQENSAFGHNALKTNNASFNTAIGSYTLSSNTTGTYNTAIGKGADVGSGALTNATAIGNGAIVAASNTIQLGNTDVTNVNSSGSFTANGVKIGRGAGNVSTNTAVGRDALLTNTTGASNTALGTSALEKNSTAGFNVGIGFEALKNTTTGGNNTAVGRGAMLNNTTGDVNTAVGEFALVSNTTGRYNTSIGHESQFQNTAGNSNTAIGAAAIDRMTSGSNNVAFGGFAGRYFGAGMSNNNTGMNNSILIGYDTRPLANNGSNEIVIGTSAIGNGSNTTTIGGASTTDTYLKGNVHVSNQIKISGGSPGAGKVLTSDANGLASWTTPASSSSTAHYIGESYGGGIVFYVWDNGAHGLIAATSDQGVVRWGANYNSTRARADGVGAGLTNTAIIIANQGPVDGNSFAATVCNEYSVTSGGVVYGGWYLPSKHELELLFAQKNILTGLTGSWYYSSTEASSGSIGGSSTVFDRAWLINGNGSSSSWWPNDKAEAWSVRAIRAF